MKRVLTVIVVSILALAVLLFVGTKLFPAKSATIMLSGLKAASGLSTKTVDTPFGPVNYLEGGTGETVLLVHGIFARKEHWIDMSRQLTGDYRVILLDLPGFGDNPVLGAGQYDIARQAENLATVVDALNLHTFHIGANSMGAPISAMLAIAQPDRVQSLAFIGSPLGVTSEMPSDMDTHIAQGKPAPLIVQSVQDFKDRNTWLFPKTPYIPGPVFNTWAKAEAANATNNLRIWSEVEGSPAPRLEDIAANVTQPTMIAWCPEDRIFHYSGAQVLLDRMPNAQTVPVTGCGHVPMLDKPAETGQHYLTFLKSVN